MVEDHCEAVILKPESGLGMMIKLKQFNNINLMFKIFSQVPNARKLFEVFLVNRVTEDCESIIDDGGISENPRDFIEKCIEAKQKYTTIITQSCEKDNDINLAIKNAFESSLAKFQQSSLYLAKYIDLKMKKEIKTLKDQEISTLFDKIMDIFRLLPEKDEFEAYYRNNLSKRLLIGTGLNEEAEKLMISKLKIECGFQYTSKLETMMKDMAISDNLNQLFKHFPYSNAIPFNFKIKVLTSGNWANENQTTLCKIPQQLDPAINSFTDFYMKNHSGRVLTWKMNLGNADVLGRFDERDYEFTVSCYQMTVLMLFNDADKLSIDQIASLSCITPEYEFKRHILSLIKVKILLKNTKEFVLNGEDLLKVNDKFKNRLHKLKVPLLNQKDPLEEEKKVVIPKVEDDRKHLIEATIVRVMKARKRLDHNSLTSEVMKIISAIFQPTPLLIKQKIEALIEKDYMSRDTEDRKVYIYKA